MKGTSRAMLSAMLCAGAVTAQLVSGKATRDALFLASLDFTALPTMLVATSVFSILLVAPTREAAAESDRRHWCRRRVSRAASCS